MSNGGYTQLLAPQMTDIGTIKSNFSAYQDIVGSSDLLLPQTSGIDLVVGSKITIDARGWYATSGTTPTLSIGGIYGATEGAAGGTAFAQSSAITLANTAAAAWPWIYEYEGVVRKVGTSGELVGMGSLKLGSSLTAFNPDVPVPVTDALRTVVIDTTVTKKWGLGAAFSAAAATNQIRCLMLNISLLNQGKT